MGLRDRLNKPDRTTAPTGVPVLNPATSLSGISITVYQDLKHELHQKLIEKLDLSTIEKLPRSQLHDELRLILSGLLAGTELPLNRQEREAMVDGILCVSVVHRMNTTHSGGSSSVLSSALKASLVI